MTAVSPPPRRQPARREDAAGAVSPVRHRDAKVVGIVSAAHFFSHFYNLVLPPLFPLLKQEFGVSYTALGLLVSAMSLASGVALLPVGFLVDRFGPVLLLAGGIAIEAAAVLLMGFVSSYWMLLMLAILAGLGGSVFHPADYTILSATVRYERLGRAFSMHTFAGHVGWAVAPALMAGFAATFGWRTGLVFVGLVGFGAAFVVFANRALLRQRPAARGVKIADTRPGVGEFRLLAMPPILMCFAFFLLIAIAMTGFDTFLVSAFVASHRASLSSANLALTAMFAGSAVGVLVGGVIADRTQRHSLVAAVGLGIAAVLIVTVGAVTAPIAALIGLVAAAGFASGVVPPSRDLIVRSVTPEGSTGKTFAFVSVGLDVGGVITPLVYGWIMDFAGTHWMYWLTAIIMAAAIATVFGTRRTP